MAAKSTSAANYLSRTTEPAHHWTMLFWFRLKQFKMLPGDFIGPLQDTALVREYRREPTIGPIEKFDHPIFGRVPFDFDEFLAGPGIDTDESASTDLIVREDGFVEYVFHRVEPDDGGDWQG